MENYDKYKDFIKSRLSEKRYHHSLCVADEALRLAEKYGADKEKMYLAGLLHDCTKNLTDEEQLMLCRELGIKFTDDDMLNPLVWHGITASYYVNQKLGIHDEDIISAIRYHTTGKADMTLSQKIIYIADITSKERNYPDVDVVRKKVDESLEDAILYSLKYLLKSLSDSELPIHPDTLSAYNFLIKERNENNGKL